jgi:hypothetical protein
MGGPADQVLISIDPGQKFDFDSQVADLRSDVAKIKQVCLSVGPWRAERGPVRTTSATRHRQHEAAAAAAAQAVWQHAWC